MSLDSDPGLLWMYWTLLCDWFRKLTPSSQPIRCKAENNRDLVARVFPRFKQFPFFHFVHFEFSLANDDINLCSDWLLGLIWFCFSTFSWKLFWFVFRLEYRQGWDKDFREYLKELDNKKPVILCGDLNVAHKEIGM